MKKLFFLALVLCSLKGFSQYPTGQTIGADSTLVTSKGGLKGRIINWTYTDTTAANLQRIRQYPGAQIFTTSNESFWLRNSTATAWIGVSGGGGGGPGVTVTSYGKNATGDSSILLLSDGTRYAALDSVGSGTSTINIITDSSISICTGVGSCDTIIINTVSVNNVTILNDSTLVVCDSLFACDTININPSPFGNQGLQQVIDVNPDLNKNDTIRTFATLLSISSLTNGTGDLKAGLNIIRQTTGTAADGIGSTLDFSTQASDGNIYKSNQISSSWDTANAVNRTSKFAIRGLSNAQPSEDLLTVKGTGQIIANKYGLGTFTGTPTYAIYEDAAGHFIEVIPPIPPTLTATYPIIYNNVTGDISADTTTALTGLATHFYADSGYVRTRNVAVDTLRLYRKNGDSTDVLFDLLAYGVTSYGKNITRDSTILLAGGVRFAAKDSTGSTDTTSLSSRINRKWDLSGNTIAAGSDFIGTNNNASFRTHTNGVERMVVDSTGQVGIGTVAPQVKLEVVGTNQLTMVVRNPDSLSASTLRLFNNANSNLRALELGYSGSAWNHGPLYGQAFGEGAYLASVGNYPLSLGTRDSMRVLIDSIGRVRLTTINTGTGSDSVLVVNGGFIKKVLQSSITGTTSTTSEQEITASGSTAFTFSSVPATYSDYQIFRNGILNESTTDYSTSGNIVTIPSVVTGDRIVLRRTK